MAPLVTLNERQSSTCVASAGKRMIAYRSGLVLQAAGAALLAILYPLDSPFYSAGIMVFELGTLVSGVCMLVRMAWIKKLIVTSICIGILVQILGLTIVPPEYAILVIVSGIGLVCMGAAGIAGKEAYCFGYREGWLLTGLYPMLILVNIAGHDRNVVNALGFSAHFLLVLILAGKKLRQPLHQNSSAMLASQQQENP